MRANELIDQRTYERKNKKQADRPDKRTRKKTKTKTKTNPQKQNRSILF